MPEPRHLPIVSGVATPPAAEPAPKYLSQSEVSDWQLCPFRAHARWILGYRAGREETAPQRIGSMGHAILADMVAARWSGRPEDPEAAAEVEAHKRGWAGGVDEDEYERALSGARLAADAVDLRHVNLAPDLYSASPGGPLAESELRVTWASLRALYIDHGADNMYQPIEECRAVLRHFVGLEGHIDLGVFPQGPGGPLAVVDWKLRQSLDLGGADDDFTSLVPDRQFAWYSTLLRALGLRPAGGIELWQVNAYAGRWLTVDDFLRIAEGGAASEAEHALIVSGGLPTRDPKRYSMAGAAVTADVWAEAHRVLANRRHAKRMDEWIASRKAKPRPDVLTIAEREGADRFLADLQDQRPVVVRKMRADPLVCLEVVRDSIVAIDGPLRQTLAGMPPVRNLQSWPRSPCSRSGGCPVQTPCLSSLGTDRGVDVLRAMAEAERMAREASRENMSEWTEEMCAS